VTVEAAPRPDPSSPAGPSGGKDRILDLVRITAIGRVVLWHTWSWAWLTWIPAMPAMFFVTGALLEGSVARRGWRATLGPRLRRLLVPYWVYAVACWIVMVIDGWRPTLGDAAKWAFPLLDPIGSDRMPGLWVPLWYLRAYLWFLLAAGVIRAVQRRLGSLSVVLSAAAAVGLWWAEGEGQDVPGAEGDAVT
jgi:fucose 4-O-acetylase-like acetyltransferase